MKANIAVTRYKQNGVTYICSGDAHTSVKDARTAAEGVLHDGEALVDDMERVDGCCTWTVVKR